MQWVKFIEGRDYAVIAVATKWIKAKAIDGFIRQGEEDDADKTAQLIVLYKSVKRLV